MSMALGYLYPSSVEEALDCLEAHAGKARLIAGGTDLLPDIRKGDVAPDYLVDVTRIPELGTIEIGDQGVVVGAAVSFGAMRAHPFLKEQVHALVEAAASVGAGAIQNAATWAGNIVQAMPAADGAIVGIALDAEAQIVDRDGARWEAVESLFEGPGVSAIDPTREMVAAIRFRRPEPGTGTAWRRVGRRAALVLPILNCAVTVTLEKGAPAPADGGRREEQVARATVALGPVAPRPKRMRQAESFLRGRVPTAESLREAGHLAAGEARPRTSVMRASEGYRREIVPVLVEDALRAALDRARGRGDGPGRD